MTGYPQKRGGHGRKIGVYADLPIKRSCDCPEPVVYDDEDDLMVGAMLLVVFAIGTLVGAVLG